MARTSFTREKRAGHNLARITPFCIGRNSPRQAGGRPFQPKNSLLLETRFQKNGPRIGTPRRDGRQRRDPSVLVPADAPSPPGAYFQIRKEFPLDLTLEAPFAFK